MISAHAVRLRDLHRAVARVVTLGALTLGFAACGGATPSSHPVATPPEHTLTSIVAGRLASLFIPAGRGFLQQPDAVGDTGPLDLEKAARTDGGPNDALAVLTKDGFVAGYQRRWVRQSDQTEVSIDLYQFSNPVGAVSYEQRNIAVRQPPQFGTFVVTGMSGAAGIEGTVFTNPAPPPNGTPIAAVFLPKVTISSM